MTYRELIQKIEEFACLDDEVVILDRYKGKYYSVSMNEWIEVPDEPDKPCLVVGQYIQDTPGNDPNFVAGY